VRAMPRCEYAEYLRGLERDFRESIQ
jgi:hypothetical protein